MLRTYLILIWIFLAFGQEDARAEKGNSLLGHGRDAGSVKEPYSDTYRVVVKSRQGAADTSFVYVSRAAKSGPQREWGAQKGKNFHFCNLTLTAGQPLSVLVYKLGSKATDVQVRPTRAGYGNLHTTQSNGAAVAAVTIQKAGKLSIEFSDDSLRIDPLMLFVNNEEKSELVPNKADNAVLVAHDSSSLRNIPVSKKIIYFDKGMSNIGYWRVPGHVTQIYLADDALVSGYIECNRNGNSVPITVNGRGIITNSRWRYHYPSTKDINVYEHNSNWYKSLFIYGGSGHLIEGITFIDPTSFVILLNADSSRVDNVKIHGFRFNNDAITVLGKQISITDCFIRVNDDAIVPNVKDGLSVENCVFWQLQAGSIFQLGWTPHSLKNIEIKNCDVLHAEWLATNENSGFINAMGMMKNTNDAVIENVSVQNIYFDTPVTRFLDIQNVRKSKRNEPHLGRGNPWIYRNCTFDNIYFNERFDSKKVLVYFSGFSGDFPSQNLSFTNFHFQNKKLSQSTLKKIINAKNIKDLKVR